MSKPRFVTQFSSFPYRRLIHLAAGTCIPMRKETSLSFKFQSKTLVNATCYNLLESNPLVGIFSFGFTCVLPYIHEYSAPLNNLHTLILGEEIKKKIIKMALINVLFTRN